MTDSEKSRKFVYQTKGDRTKAPAVHLHRLDRGKVKLKQYKVMKIFYFIIALALLVIGASLNRELTAMGCSSAPFALAAFGFALAGIASAVHDFNQKHNYK